MAKEIIDEIELRPIKVKLREPFIISLGRLDYADNVSVVIKTKSGLVGFGECSPFRSIHGETSETCIAVGKIIKENLLGVDVLDIEGNIALMDKIIFGNTSIKSAFDMAMYDISAREKSVPLYKFLGGENNKEIFTDYTVSLSSVEKMVTDAQKIKSEGYTVIKVKLGGAADDDILRMKSIRAAVGMEIPIRIDANQGWSKTDAVYVLKSLQHLNIQHCEEPINKHSFLDLPEIKNQSPIPIMADESCCDHHDAERLIRINACELFNIKLGKSGGIFKALKILKIAEHNHMNVQVGGFLESRLGFTASAHLALSSSAAKYFDFDTPLMFEEDPVRGGIEYGSNGKIIVGNEIGLGAEFI